MASLGSVARLVRYPVKSLLGEAVAAIRVSERGLSGDRTHALIDAGSGNVASAKNPRLWRRLLTLAAVEVPASAEEPSGVRITFPDGAAALGTEPDASVRLSRFLGRSVTLTRAAPAKPVIERARPDEVLERGEAAPVTVDVSPLALAAPEGTFFDYAPIHLITSATLAALEAQGRSGGDARRFRPNLVIQASPGCAAFHENHWVGRRLAVGWEVELRVLVSTPRCAVPALAHGELGSNPGILRALAQFNRVAIAGLGTLPCAGVYAQVVASGWIQTGDPVSLMD